MIEEKQSVEIPNRVKIKINAKGMFSGEVIGSAKSSEEAMKLATRRANELETIINEKNGGK